MERSRQQTLSGWGRFGQATCAVYRPHKRSAVAGILAGEGSLIARGLGRSYGDQALNGGGGVIDHTRLDRMLEFSEGELTCEAGISLAAVLRTFLPRGGVVRRST